MTSCLTGWLAGWQAGRQTDREAERQRDREKDMRQGGGEACEGPGPHAHVFEPVLYSSMYDANVYLPIYSTNKSYIIY
jgi:hypothetical protein